MPPEREVLARVAWRSVMRKKVHSDELRTIPGVGPSIAADLRAIGIRRVVDLRGQDPQRLYEHSNARRGVQQDRCLLYVFRCAVYFATVAKPHPARLKWWAWKDAPRPAR
jgi:hypothetical protein